MPNTSISTMIQRLGVHMQSAFKGQDFDDNITNAQVKILMFVAHRYEENQPVFQKDIEREFNIKGSSVTSLLNALEKNKWISREKVDYDARLRKIVLAETSYKMMDEMREFWAGIDESIKNTLTDAEFIVFCQCIEKILNAFPI